ncbi:MAG: zinc ribbon domain-containing protein [Lachnospiraceae bacterium]|nr:zinc ribbon domain-containing protein [Lachnospiraceae bacterium]
MKCEQCQAPVTLEDEFCPYCGALNKPARRHIEDMKHFSADYEQTKRKVLGRVAGQSHRYALLITLVVLVVLNIGVFAMQLMSDEIRWWREEQAVKKQAVQLEHQMAQLEEVGDYDLLNRLYMDKNLYSVSDRLRAFDAVSDGSYDFTRIRDSFYYLKNPGTGYQDEGDLLETISERTVDFYELLDYEYSDYLAERFEGSHGAALEDLKVKIEAMLKTYGQLTDEDVAGLPDMSSQEILILLGRRMGIYES